MVITIADGFGEWESLGSISATLNWQLFPNPTNSNSGLLRLSFSGQLENIHSYAHIRCLYETPTRVVQGRWMRVYPSELEQLVNYRHPLELYDNTNLIRKYQIKKYFRYRQWADKPFEGNWACFAQIHQSVTIAIGGGGGGGTGNIGTNTLFFLGLF